MVLMYVDVVVGGLFIGGSSRFRELGNIGATDRWPGLSRYGSGLPLSY